VGAGAGFGAEVYVVDGLLEGLDGWEVGG